MQRATYAQRSALPVLIGVLAVSLLLCGASSADPADSRYDNTFMKDFIMDAPWRVIDASTPIPLTVVLKDCDTDDIRELHWVRCWDITSGETLIWDHDFGDEQIGDDVYESNFWTWITTVTEGHPTLPDGTLLTPSNLGYSDGDAINLKMSVYYRDDWFNYTETRFLRVRVGHGAYPWPEGWYGGDTHYHTMYTNNIAEFGAPLPAVVLAAKALGLSWLTTTDHSCDLDETGDGAFSYATTHWEYTIQDQTGTETVYRDNTALGYAWGAIGDEVAAWDSPELRLYRAVELNASSVDADSYQKTLHSLFYNDAYIASPLSGAIGERPVTPTLSAALSQLSGGGFAYAAHPMSDMSAEWGGIDWTINGAAWGDEDIATALGFESFRGLEAFNTRATRYSSDQANPWADFDAGVSPDSPYPQELLAGVEAWDACLRASLEPLRKVFFAGGSDAHGDFNYGSFLSLDSYATDNAIGKVQTVVHVPGGWRSGDLPPMADILEAYREGRSVVTDGPFVETGVDANEDGDFDDPGDLAVGSDVEVSSAQSLPLTVRWRSNPDFGPVVRVEIIAGDESGTWTLHALDPSQSGEGFSGETTVDLTSYGFAGRVYFRAECRSDLGGDVHRAYANPMWVLFDDTSVADAVPAAPLVSLSGNPFRQDVAVRFAAPARATSVRLSVYDVSGRLVRVLYDSGGPAIEGSNATSYDVCSASEVSWNGEVCWNGRDESGRRVSSGVYLFRLTSDRGPLCAAKGVLVK
jgi:hypothetical protein